MALPPFLLNRSVDPQPIHGLSGSAQYGIPALMARVKVSEDRAAQTRGNNHAKMTVMGGVHDDDPMTR
ncbi:hypothetical protein E2C01_060689 [Portunus trituberculatus]|uniref:Uncharacterized protein n=1 Tax=Portunus trituberculatus TaxID=210409 RepID=A0A5B7H384_PORTR|nr:hypothetical protein [Portunus trituberculatus]